MMTLRTALGCTNLTQEDLAKYFKVHKNTVSNWITGKTDVGINQYQEILEFLSDNLSEFNLVSEIESYLATEKNTYVLCDTNMQMPRLQEISAYEIAERYVYAGLDPIKVDFLNGSFGKVDDILMVVANDFEHENDHMGSVQIDEPGCIMLTAQNVIGDLQIGSIEEIAEQYPDLFKDENEVQSVVDGFTGTDEQRAAICEYLNGCHPLLETMDLDF